MILLNGNQNSKGPFENWNSNSYRPCPGPHRLSYFNRDPGGQRWPVNDHGRYFFPQLQLVKHKGGSSKNSLQEGSPVSLVSMGHGNSWHERYNQWYCQNMPDSPFSTKAPDKDHSDQGDMPWRKLTYWSHTEGSWQFQVSLGASKHIFWVDRIPC